MGGYEHLMFAVKLAMLNLDSKRKSAHNVAKMLATLGAGVAATQNSMALLHPDPKVSAKAFARGWGAGVFAPIHANIAMAQIEQIVREAEQKIQRIQAETLRVMHKAVRADPPP